MPRSASGRSSWTRMSSTTSSTGAKAPTPSASAALLLLEAAHDLEHDEDRRGPQPGHQRGLDPGAFAFGQLRAAAVDLQHIVRAAGRGPIGVRQQVDAENK